MKTKHPTPPKWATRFLLWFLKEELAEEVEGDLAEKFNKQFTAHGASKARLHYYYQVIHYLRPFAIRNNIFSNLNPFFMLGHHLKISWRTLFKNKGYSLINIGGLAIGMAVAILLGLWVKDEISFNEHHQNYSEIARVIQHRNIGGEIKTWSSTPFPLGDELLTSYGSNFKHVVKSSWGGPSNLKVDNQDFNKTGTFIQAQGIEMLAPKMIYGKWDALDQPNSIVISKSLSNIIAGKSDPTGKMIKINDRYEAQVTGVYDNFPTNSSYDDNDFFASWDIFLTMNRWISEAANPWQSNSFSLLVQKNANTSFEKVSANIKDVIAKNIVNDAASNRSKPVTFLHPMKDWHLRANFINGVNAGGRIQYVWLFGLTGIFVLFLACINFMNLSTARSEKRAKEVGVRKAIGSKRSQLISQFFCESILVVLIALVLAIGICQLALPWFNEIADKKLALLWNDPLFWLSGISFVLFTGLLAGSYPALYLSSFNPLKVLNSSFRVGRFASLPRRVLVVIQFTVSIVLIIGTIIIYQQIQYGYNRPLGYDQNNLAALHLDRYVTKEKQIVLKDELIKERLVSDIATTNAPPTNIRSTSSIMNWKGKDPNVSAIFPFTGISPDYGKTIGWELIEGRNFSKDLASDSASVIINESALKYMGLENPIGEKIEGRTDTLYIIGVVKNTLVESPYEAVRPHFYYNAGDYGNILLLKLNPDLTANKAIREIESIIKTHYPESRHRFEFVDEAFDEKFRSERRVAILSSLFGALAIFISCLGLFGLASYIAERRSKEISIRKILGASIANLWSMLSKEFILLVLISFIISIPLSYYVIKGWLENYNYHVDISWWVFAISGMAALVLTLITVSFQAIRAATVNPVNALKQN